MSVPGLLRPPCYWCRLLQSHMVILGVFQGCIWECSGSHLLTGIKPDQALVCYLLCCLLFTYVHFLPFTTEIKPFLGLLSLIVIVKIFIGAFLGGTWFGSTDRKIWWSGLAVFGVGERCTGKLPIYFMQATPPLFRVISCLSC